MCELENTKVVIFETFPKFCKSFHRLPFMKIRNQDVTETKHTIDMQNYFLRHERDYTVKRGKEIKEALENNKSLIFTIEILDVERIAFFVYSVVNYFYRKAYLRAYKNYSKTERIICVLEEAQNIFDSSTISKTIFNRLRKIFSEARNLNLHFVMCSQRLQDLNTKIRGRTRLILGGVSIDDYELKIRKLLRHSKYRKEILEFDRGVFLDVTNDKKFTFPLFKPTGQPYEIMKAKTPKPKIQPPMKQGLLSRLTDCFISKEDKIIREIQDYNSNLATDLEREEQAEDEEDLSFFLYEEEWNS